MGAHPIRADVSRRLRLGVLAGVIACTWCAAAVAPDRAQGLSCVLVGPERALATNDVVFRGKVLETTIDSGRSAIPDPFSVRFAVLEYLKGRGPQVAEVTQSAIPGAGPFPPPREGEVWTVYADRTGAGDDLIFDVCFPAGPRNAVPDVVLAVDEVAGILNPF